MMMDAMIVDHPITGMESGLDEGGTVCMNYSFDSSKW
jgi:hypothetical protein